MPIEKTIYLSKTFTELKLIADADAKTKGFAIVGECLSEFLDVVSLSILNPHTLPARYHCSLLDVKNKIQDLLGYVGERVDVRSHRKNYMEMLAELEMPRVLKKNPGKKNGKNGDGLGGFVSDYDPVLPDTFHGKLIHVSPEFDEFIAEGVEE